jgi:hypothetical protein
MTTLDAAVAAGELTTDGDAGALQTLMGLLDSSSSGSTSSPRETQDGRPAAVAAATSSRRPLATS